MHLVGLNTCYLFVPIVAVTAWINFYGCNPLLHLSSQNFFCTVMVTYHSKVLQGIIYYSSSYSYHGTCVVSIGRSTSTLRSARMPSHSMRPVSAACCPATARRDHIRFNARFNVHDRTGQAICGVTGSGGAASHHSA